MYGRLARPSMAPMAWTADTAIGADTQQVMEVLTRPCAISSWAPVPFEVEGLKSDRLETGSRARVAGMLAGKELAFDVEVHEASDGTLRLTAVGRFVAKAVEGFLAGGALNGALGQLALAAENHQVGIAGLAQAA